MRKLIAGSFAVCCAVGALLASSVGSASASPLYDACTTNDTNSPCYWHPTASYDSSPVLIMQGGPDYDFEAANLSSGSRTYYGCYGPSGTITTCDGNMTIPANGHGPALVTNVDPGDGLVAVLVSNADSPTNLWFPYT